MGLPTRYAWGLVVISFCFMHLLEDICLYVYYDDTNIVLVTIADVGEVGRPMAQLVGHRPIRRPRGARGG